MALSIHPSVGIARLGNADGNDFVLNPIKIGGLPYEHDDNLQPTTEVIYFKDEAGRVRRQGQVFKVLDEQDHEITLDSENVKSIEWNVHLANKKAAWYAFSELNGNLLYGEANSYKNRGIEWRNPSVTSEPERQKLIIDLGPRTVSGSLKSAEFDKDNIPSNYTKASYPGPVLQGEDFKSLGTLLTDDKGRLIVLGGYGRAGGNTDLEGYGGGDEWFDDISDGPVTCVVTYTDGSPAQTMKAWVVVGSPDFAPEIVNISTLNDTFFDVGVRHFDLVPNMYAHGEFNNGFVANFERDIQPIIHRISQYQWVANVQSMSGFFSYQFDYRDNSDGNKPNRMKYYNYFRQLDNKVIGDYDQPQQTLMSSSSEGEMLPMMPMNSGSNSVKSANAYDLTDNVVEKFLALDATQMFLLKQWAEGKFTLGATDVLLVNEMDAASIGNCVGLPMCPGIEVTWSLQNSKLYESAYQIKHFKDDYSQQGLSPSRDECEGGGCEPGDLTKRMACPWQADFFNCTVQVVNFSEPKVNKATQVETSLSLTKYNWKDLPDGVKVPKEYQVLATQDVEEKTPLPPAYYSYWWPPQSPWDVLTGELDVTGQLNSHLPAGQQINYARGINSYGQMVEHWSALAFIRDRNAKNEGFPYFTESERNHELFDFKEVGVGQISGNSEDNDTTIPVFFINTNKVSLDKLKGETDKKETKKGKLMTQYFEERAFKPVRTKNTLHRSGTRMRG
jgi:L-lysine 6-oxidase